MHKRFWGLLATAAIVVAACGGTTSTASPAAFRGRVFSGWVIALSVRSAAERRGHSAGPDRHDL